MSMALLRVLRPAESAVRRLIVAARGVVMTSPKFTSPLRPGRPPGYRKKPRDDIDFVLKECHALARDVIAEDTS
jgi:hypothetical protein